MLDSKTQPANRTKAPKSQIVELLEGVGFALRDVACCAKLCEIMAAGNHPADKFAVTVTQEEDPVKNTKFGVFFVPEIEAYVVVWRGSDTPTDWLTDLQFAPNNHPHISEFRVHGGIQSSFQTFLDQRRGAPLVPPIHPAKRVIFTGHSLGGAMALLCLFHTILREQGLAPENQDLAPANLPASAVLFGAPMVFSVRPEKSQVAQRIETEMYKRSVTFVNKNDIVPRLPLFLDFAREALKQQITEHMASWGWYVAGYASDGVDELISKLQGDGLARMVSDFKHISTVLHLDRHGVSLVETKDLNHFDPIHGASRADSLRHHLMVAHFDAMERVFEQQSQPLFDTQFRICQLSQVYKGNNLLAPFQLRADTENVNKFCQAASNERPASVVSFNGNSRAGKSYLIRALQKFESTPRRGPYVNADINSGTATTGDVNLFRFDHGWLMDCEGTNGSDVPETLGKAFLDLIAPDRRRSVMKTLPPFALLSSDIFCFVTREPVGNLAAYDECLKYAKMAWRNVANASFPSLIVIQNYQPLPLMTSDQATEILLSHDKTTELTKCFHSVRVFQFPHNDPDIFKRVDGQVVSFADLFEKNIKELHSYIVHELDRQHQIKKERNVLIMERTWFGLVEMLSEAVNKDEPISMGHLAITLLLPKDDLFRDVWNVFSMQIEKLFLLMSIEDVAHEFQRVVHEAAQHAGRTIAVVSKFKSSLKLGEEAILSTYGKQLASKAEAMSSLVPCRALPRRLDLIENEISQQNHELFCGQPSSCHKQHRSMHTTSSNLHFFSRLWRQGDGLSTSFWNEFRFQWKGEYEPHPDCKASCERFVDDVVKAAIRYQDLDVNMLEEFRRCCVRELRQNANDFEYYPYRLSQQSHCYACLASLEGNPWSLFAWLRSSYQKIAVCRKCEQLLDSNLHAAASQRKGQKIKE